MALQEQAVNDIKVSVFRQLEDAENARLLTDKLNQRIARSMVGILSSIFLTIASLVCVLAFDIFRLERSSDLTAIQHQVAEISAGLEDNLAKMQATDQWIRASHEVEMIGEEKDALVGVSAMIEEAKALEMHRLERTEYLIVFLLGSVFLAVGFGFAWRIRGYRREGEKLRALSHQTAEALREMVPYLTSKDYLNPVEAEEVRNRIFRLGFGEPFEEFRRHL